MKKILVSKIQSLDPLPIIHFQVAWLSDILSNIQGAT